MLPTSANSVDTPSRCLAWPAAVGLGPASAAAVANHGGRARIGIDRSRLLWGNIVQGPAIIEELDATIVVHPGYQAEVDQHGNLVLHR